MTSKRSSSGIFALPADLHVDIRLCETGVNLTVRGEIDVHTAPLLRRRLHDVVEQGEHRVVVHLDGVTFMDSTGLGVLLGAHQAQVATGGFFELVCSDPRLLRILRITGLHQVLTIHDGTDA
jgi:anti-sigma B factor antagonist